MFKININKVKGKMAEKGFNNTSLAKEISISRNTLSSYLNNPEKTPYYILAKLAECLCDTEKEATEIFLHINLRYT